MPYPHEANEPTDRAPQQILGPVLDFDPGLSVNGAACDQEAVFLIPQIP